MFLSTVRLQGRPTSRFFSKAAQLPCEETLQGRIQYKTDSGTIVASNAAGFFTGLDTHGAAACTITDTGTDTELVDITGAGYLAWLITPASGATRVTVTLKITIDDTLETITKICTAGYYRYVFGGYATQLPATGTTNASRHSLVGGQYDGGFLNSHISVLPAQQTLSNGHAMLKFNTNLNIKIATSGNVKNYAACDYYITEE